MNQDNPFAKGVSINQDIVHEEETPLDFHNSPATLGHFPSECFFKPDMEMIHGLADDRQLLALGREEE